MFTNYASTHGALVSWALCRSGAAMRAERSTALRAIEDSETGDPPLLGAVDLSRDADAARQCSPEPREGGTDMFIAYAADGRGLALRVQSRATGVRVCWNGPRAETHAGAPSHACLGVLLPTECPGVGALLLLPGVDKSGWERDTTRAVEDLVSACTCAASSLRLASVGAAERHSRPRAASAPPARKKRRARRHTLVEAGDAEAGDPELAALCSLCGKLGDAERLLLCDGRCGTASHTDCLGLPEIPADDWYCDDCRPVPTRIPQMLPLIPEVDPCTCDASLLRGMQQSEVLLPTGRCCMSGHPAKGGACEQLRMHHAYLCVVAGDDFVDNLCVLE